MQHPSLTLSEIRELIKQLDRISDHSVTVPQVSEWLHVDRTTIYRWLRVGEHLERLPGARPARITARSILKYLEDTYSTVAGFDIFDET